MKTLKVLVVDDNQANIEAAKLASKNFPQHEFLFATSANEAFKQIGNFDAVITDLFFPEKPCEEIMETYKEISSYYSIENCFNKEYVQYSHLWDEKLEKNISIVKNGLIPSISNSSLNKPEFPLGLAIMFKAKSFWVGRHEKKFCLVSDIHSHGNCDGEILLLPLFDLIGMRNVIQDGGNSYYYIGRNRINNYEESEHIRFGDGKTSPIIWEKAIHCILAQ